MSQLWSREHAGKRGNSGIENESMRTAFVEPESSEIIIFGQAVVQDLSGKKDTDDCVTVANQVANNAKNEGQQFQGFAAFSQEASIMDNTHTGPTSKNAQYVVGYSAGDVVGVVDRGSVIVRIAAGTKGIQAGDALCVVQDGRIDAVKNITPSAGGSNFALVIDAIAESNGVAGDYVSIQLYSLKSKVIKY